VTSSQKIGSMFREFNLSSHLTASGQISSPGLPNENQQDDRYQGQRRPLEKRRCRSGIAFFVSHRRRTLNLAPGSVICRQQRAAQLHARQLLNGDHGIV